MWINSVWSSVPYVFSNYSYRSFPSINQPSSISDKYINSVKLLKLKKIKYFLLHVVKLSHKKVKSGHYQWMSSVKLVTVLRFKVVISQQNSIYSIEDISPLSSCMIIYLLFCLRLKVIWIIFHNAFHWQYFNVLHV